jgi:Phospholipid methyltransferase
VDALRTRTKSAFAGKKQISLEGSLRVRQEPVETSIPVLLATVFLVLLILSATFGLAYAVCYSLALGGIQTTIDIPLGFRLMGLAFIAACVALESYVMKYRRPFEVLVSTSETLMKLLRRRPISERKGRTEPFVPKGPYAYTRNPMYLCVVTIASGLGLAFSSTPLLVWGLLLTIWFSFVLIPFEEKELEALFGDSYADYKRQVPMLFPYGRRYRQETRIRIE